MKYLKSFLNESLNSGLLNIIILGAPGSGKGTQSKKIASKYKLKHLSTGDILRSEISKKTSNGIQAQKYMDKGEMVPDEIMINIVKSKINEFGSQYKGFIFDGFPRTKEQAHILDKILRARGSDISLLIELDVDQGELVRRLLKRGETSGRSDDSDISIIKKRIRIYHQQTEPIIGYYEKQGKFKKVKGVGNIEVISSDIDDAISNIK